MQIGLASVVAALNTVTLVCGGSVTYLSYRAYRRTGSPPLRALAVGLGFVTVGVLVAGALHQLLGVTLSVGIVVQSAFTAIGFAIVTYSLFVSRERPTAAAI